MEDNALYAAVILIWDDQSTWFIEWKNAVVLKRFCSFKFVKAK